MVHITNYKNGNARLTRSGTACAVHLHTQVSSPNRDPLYTQYRHARFGRKRWFRKVATGLLVHET
ncbi:unnamed protein product [Ixodes persulcatus]